MRIDRLTLENFKGFEKRDFEFHPAINLVVGVNGAGKTTLLDALAIAAGGWFLGVGGRDARQIKPFEVRSKPVAVSPHRGNGQTPAFTWESQYPCIVQASGVVQEQAISWRRSLNGPGGRTTRVGAAEIRALAANADRHMRAGTPAVLPVLSYYGTGRLWNVPREQAHVRSPRALTRKEGKSRLSGYRNSLDPRVSVSELTRWIAGHSWAAYQHGAISPAFEAVRKAILDCIEDGRDLYFDPRRGEMIVEIGRQGPQPFNNLSDGQRTMLALVGDLAQRAALLNPAFGSEAIAETPGVVLIDELDLHLHPVWQRRVIEDLRRTFPRIQFFATTHSPFLIQSLRSGEELVMLDGLPTAQLGNKTLADIAHGIMGVTDPSVSKRYGEMKDTALHFLEALERSSTSPKAKLKELEEQLAKSTAPYADNPAYQAFLEMKLAAKLGN